MSESKLNALGVSFMFQNNTAVFQSLFCQMHDLNYHQFLYWCDQFSEKPKKLMPVEVSSIGELLLNILLSNGALLEI